MFDLPNRQVDLDAVAQTVAAKVNELTATSHVLDQAIRWRPDRWQAANLGPLAQYLGPLVEATEPYTAQEHLVRRRHAAGFEDPAAQFLAAMIWGFGVRGYGPARVEAIVHEAGERLIPALESISGAARAGAADAWDAFTDSHKLKGLGPAFATKLAYYAALANDITAANAPLIADLNTSWAMWDLVRLPRSVERRDSYLTYVDLARRWAADVGRRPDDVEWALFELGKSVPRTRSSR